jgi:hypothetical protein
VKGVRACHSKAKLPNNFEFFFLLFFRKEFVLPFCHVNLFSEQLELFSIFLER